MEQGTPGTLGWARWVFADELERLRVVSGNRQALDDRLDELARRVGVSRPYLIRAYLTEDGIRVIARQVAATSTGRDVTLLEAEAAVAADHPESAGWPDEVRDYLIDHIATATAARDYASAFTDDRVGVEPLALLRFRYLDTTGLVDELGYGADDLVPIVTIQHRDLLERPGPLRADRHWGRPRFEWAYQIVHDHYLKRRPAAGERLLWAWADLPTVLSAHRPDLATPEALSELAAVAPRHAVIVAARVPLSRCLFTSHVLFDALMLRGRYLPEGIDDALDLHRRLGRCHLDRLDPDDALHDAIVNSWTQRLFNAPHHWLDVRLQACVDRVERHEIISVTPLSTHRPHRPDTAAGDGIEPEPLE